MCARQGTVGRGAKGEGERMLSSLPADPVEPMESMGSIP